MRELQKRINELQPYVKEFKFQDGYTIVSTNMSDKWVTLPSKVVGVDGDGTTKFFFSNMEDVGVDDILDYIEEIINYNREEEMKVELLRLKIDELGVLFHNNSLDVLKTLEFNLVREDIESGDNEVSEETDVPLEESEIKNEEEA